jgi:hypothetical protein
VSNNGCGVIALEQELQQEHTKLCFWIKYVFVSKEREIADGNAT